MKESKTILARHSLLILTFQVLIVILVALPPLEPYRQQLAEIIHFPVSAFWIPLLAILTIVNLIALRRIRANLVRPLEDLVAQSKQGTVSIAFKNKSRNLEEDHLKHFIESQSLRSSDLELEVTRMEHEVESMIELTSVSPEEVESLRSKVAEAETQKEELSSEVVSEQTKAAKLENDLIAMRRELKQAKRELETLRNEAETETNIGDLPPLTSILVEKLKTPLSLINNLAWRLSKSWADTPPAKVREGLEEISKHSEEQLALLKKYQVEETSEEERGAL